MSIVLNKTLVPHQSPPQFTKKLFILIILNVMMYRFNNSICFKKHLKSIFYMTDSHIEYMECVYFHNNLKFILRGGIFQISDEINYRDIY